MAEDLGCFVVGPVVDDDAEEVDVGVEDGLGCEEVVWLVGYAGGGGGGEGGEGGGAGVGGAAEGGGEVFHDEGYVGKGGREGDAGVAGGAADLRVGEEV